MESMENISEYWFHEYWRVLLIGSGDHLIVSVDVYRTGWFWNTDSMECLSDGKYCLLYHNVSRDELDRVLGELSKYIVKAEIVGVKAGERFETVNVRYTVSRDRELTYNDISDLFYSSWKLIGCTFRDVEDIECSE